MPKYSIVVPTLNRSHLLEKTLESLARINHDSFEVVISNNSSTDNTEEVARRWTASDSRFKYIRTEKKLCMSDHWDFAFRAVSGDYFLISGDDDSYERNIFLYLDRLLDGKGSNGVHFRSAVYYYPSWFQESYAGKLFIPPVTGETRMMSSEATLKRLFAVDFSVLPEAQHFCFKTSIARSLAEQYGAFFLRPYPDYTASIMYLSGIDEYLYVDLPLTIGGASKDSNAASTVKGPNDRMLEFIAEHDGPMYPNVPVDIQLLANGEVESLRAVQVMLGREMEGYEVDWVMYFRKIYYYLMRDMEYVKNGDSKRKFFKALLKMPFSVQRKVYPHILRGEALRLPRYLKGRVSGNGQDESMVLMENRYVGHFSKALPDIVACSQELTDHNASLSGSLV